jgi:hypothetical protein
VISKLVIFAENLQTWVNLINGGEICFIFSWVQTGEGGEWEGTISI